jgi:hypothetical protein
LSDGDLRHKARDWPWDGQEARKDGQVVGLRLDLMAGTLEVFLDGRRLGVMARGLVGPLCWHVELRFGVAICIKGKPPPAL